MKSIPGSRETLWRPGPADAGRKSVLSAAAEVFEAHGYPATSMDMIADRLGATKGRIYHYYRGKPEIFFDVVEQGMHELLAMVDSISEDSALSASERLRRMIRGHAETMMRESHPQLVAMQMVQFRNVPELAGYVEVVQRVVGLRRRYSNYFEAVMHEGITTEEFLETDVNLASKSLLGSLNWIAVWFRAEEETAEDEIERIATFYADMHLRALLRKGR